MTAPTAAPEPNQDETTEQRNTTEDEITSMRKQLASQDGFDLHEQLKWQNDDYCKQMKTLYPDSQERILKCKAALVWRRDNAELMTESPENNAAIGRALQTGSLYWFGYDLERRPILWVRSSVKDWKHYNTHDELAMHLHLLDQAILHYMPEGVSQFCLIAEAELTWGAIKTSRQSIAFFKQLSLALRTCYSGRLAHLYIVKPHSFGGKALINAAFAIVAPLLSPRVRAVIEFIPHAQAAKRLSQVIGEQSVPQWLGGPASVQHLEIREANQASGVVTAALQLKHQELMLKQLQQHAAPPDQQDLDLSTTSRTPTH